MEAMTIVRMIVYPGVGISKLDRKYKLTIDLRYTYDDVTTRETGNWKG